MTESTVYYSDYQKRSERELITPEGVDLKVRLADAGARAGAFFTDIVIMFVALFVLTWGVAQASIDTEGEWVFVIWTLIFFFLRSFYFIYFESGPKAATPGKRLFKIRVASRTSARLSAGSVFTRNALREIEVFLPLSFLSANLGDVDGQIAFAGLAWSLVFLFFPLFNKDRLRAGDLMAGTWVVQAPKPMLADDLADDRDAALSARFAFTPEQIAAYGVHELQVLEDVIRVNDEETLMDVAERIRKKINWEKSVGENDLDFLKAYYATLRGQLETKLLFGVRKRDKHDKA